MACLLQSPEDHENEKVANVKRGRCRIKPSVDGARRSPATGKEFWQGKVVDHLLRMRQRSQHSPLVQLLHHSRQRFWIIRTLMRCDGDSGSRWLLGWCQRLREGGSEDRRLRCNIRHREETQR